ncbi:MAG: sulfurtransferase [Acidobacteria bacterium]|nr:sulfurtransferase [Acidobacteriota bacterium]
MKRLIETCLCMMVLLLAVQAQPAKPRSARTNLLVSTDWLAKNLTNPKVVLLHIGQTRKNYDTAHIPGARFLLYADLITSRSGVVNELPPVEKLQQLFAQVGVNDDSRVILYCDTQGLLSARTYFTLDYLGLGNQAALLDGGLEKWKAEKREVSTIAPEIKAGNFTPRLNPKIIMQREAVRDISWLSVASDQPVTLLLDARQPDGYDGSIKRPDLPLSGHIPGAVNVYWTQNYVSKEAPTLKPVAELRKMYEAAGATPDKKMVTYCWIGMMASHAYFTLKYLGYDVAMYDGSFTEWAKSEGAQVVTGKNPK